MNTLDTILVSSGVSLSLLLAIMSYLIFLKTGDISRKFLVVFLLSGAIFILSFNPDYLRYNTLFIYFRTIILLLFIPSFYIYIKSVLTLDKPPFPALLKHYTPTAVVILVFVAVMVDSWLEGDEFFQRTFQTNDIRNSNSFVSWINVLIIITILAQLFIYAFKVYNTFPQYLSKLREHYSNIQVFAPGWLLWLLAGFVALYVMADVAMLLSIIGYAYYHTVFILFMIALVLSVAYFGIFMAPLVSRNKEGMLVLTILSQQLITGEKTLQTMVPAKAETETCKKDLKPLIEKLRLYIQHEKPYLNPELTLTDLAVALSTNTNYLSKAINETFGVNFNTYINQLRVKKVIEMMQDKNEQYSIWGLGQQAGFYSRSAFINAFKKETGKSPNEYMASLPQETI